MRKILLAMCLLATYVGLSAQPIAQHPLSDNKLMHYGGFIGINLPAYIVQPEDIFTPILGYGLTIGGYVDARLGKYLNLRLCPSYNANYINIKQIGKDSINTLVMPFSVPLYLKWSSERKYNYRPYLMGGGGISFDFNAFDEEKKAILTKKLNYFASIALGCDFYTQWFRCSPEIKYQFGFNNMVVAQNPDGTWGDNGWKPTNLESYMQTIEQMLYHQVSIVFNFGSL